MDVLLTTCDTHYWALRPFAYLFNKYWGRSHRVIVLGFSEIPFDLPSNFEFVSGGDFRNFPPSHWSNPILNFLRTYPEKRFIWMLEDYWLRRQVNQHVISVVDRFMEAEGNILRVDLSGDRIYAGGMRDYASMEDVDIIWSDPSHPYHMSIQAAIWDRDLLLEFMIPNETPWEFEISGSNRLGLRPDVQVLGTRQWPVRYTIGTWNGREDIVVDGLALDDVIELQSLGYLSRS